MKARNLLPKKAEPPRAAAPAPAGSRSHSREGGAPGNSPPAAAGGDGLGMLEPPREIRESVLGVLGISH